jgi:XTP/dITP diphosphohydrolase
VTEGRLRGTLRFAPAGAGGFGYDPILQPDGDSRTCAEMAPEEKHAISHRGRAFRALSTAIRELLG